MNDAEVQEVLFTLKRLRHEFEDLAVGGLRAAGPERIRSLEAMAEEFGRIGAGHIQSRLERLTTAIRTADRNAAEHLMRAQSSVRVFERILTLETAAVAMAAFAAHVDADVTEEDES